MVNKIFAIVCTLLLLYLFITKVCCYNFGEIRNIQHRNVLKIPLETRTRVFGDIVKLSYQYLGQRPLWVNYGTLLGIIRNKKFICYDTDVDFSMRLEDYNFALDQIVKLAKDHPEYIHATVNLGPLVKSIVLIHKPTGLPCDFSFYQQDGDMLSRVVLGRYIPQLREENLVYIPSDWLFPLRPDYIDVDGEMIQVLIPAQPEKFLTSYYGTNYLIPNKQCNNDCTVCQ